MNTVIRLSEDMIQQAKICAEAMNRSVTKQIEYWAKIGKIAEENPELSYSFMRDILLGQQEVLNNHMAPYQFGS